MEQTYLIILRLFHITTGVFWAGTIFYLARFIIPASNALGPDGGKFMQQLSATNKMPVVMLTAATLNIISGILLYWKLSDGLKGDWTSTHFGITISIGGLFALSAYIVGLTVNRPATFKMAALAKAIAASGTGPTPEQIQQVQAARKKLISGTNIVAVLLVVAVLCMAVGRYM